MKPRVFIALYGVFACVAAVFSVLAIGLGENPAPIWIGWLVVCFFETIILLLVEWGTRP